jgi:predicted Zn-dependent protease
MKGAILLFCLSFLVAACATTSPPPVGKDLKFEEDEKRLWLRSEEQEKTIDKSGVLYRDEALEIYLNGVAQKLQPAEIYVHIPFKVRVIRNHLLNAFAFPNGAIYIHTGLLARIDNEAQFATLLGHEMTHATHRHMIKQFRNIKNKTDVLAMIRYTTAGLGAYAAVIGSIGTIAAITGYSREQEQEADREGFRLMVNANYDPREAPKLFLHLKKELEDEKREEPFSFGTHPKLSDRVKNYEALLRDSPQGQKERIQNADLFLRKTARVILENSRDDLKAGRFKIAEAGVEKYLKLQAQSAEAYCLLGDICRQRGNENDIETAKGHYQRAITMNASYPDSYRGIGLIHYKRGEKALAKKALESYLSLSPQALDRAYIEGYIHQCEGGEKQ